MADDWEILADVLSRHAVREEKSAGPLWSPVTYREGRTRRQSNVEAVHAFVADLDGIGLEAVRDRLDGLEWIAYTTHSHAPGHPCWHVVVPLAAPVPASRWGQAWATMRAWIGAGDAQACDASRLYFLPQRHPDRDAAVDRGRGAFLDWTALPAVQGRGTGSGRGSDWQVDWDAVEEPAELAGLEGRALILAALAYVERMIDALPRTDDARLPWPQDTEVMPSHP